MLTNEKHSSHVMALIKYSCTLWYRYVALFPAILGYRQIVLHYGTVRADWELMHEVKDRTHVRIHQSVYLLYLTDI